MLSNECYDSGEEAYLTWPEADPEHSFYWNNFNVGAILLGDFNSFLPIRVCTKSAAELGFWIFVVLSVAIPVVIIPLAAWLLWRKYRKQYERWNTDVPEPADDVTDVTAVDATEIPAEEVAEASETDPAPSTGTVTEPATETKNVSTETEPVYDETEAR